MKNYRLELIIFVISLLGIKCTKSTGLQGSASLTIVNTVVGSKPLSVNFSNDNYLTYYLTAQRLDYGTYSAASNQFSSYAGMTNLQLYQYPDTSSHDTPLYDLSLDISAGTIHTLFLAGQVSTPDTLFLTDTPPYHSASDSSLGIRFINLSPGSSPVSINIKGNPFGSEINGLPYKGASPFKNYPASAIISSYIFEFRDLVSGNIITTYTISGINNGIGNNNQANLYRFKNVTLVLRGVPGGTGTTSQSVFLINNY